MDPVTKIKTVPSNTTLKLSCTVGSASTSPNPYARDPSRRAIACVTCAKAKTRCDKTLPSCSRCITKGIKCDPRSTRRTSDNNYRSISTKKAFVAPKRFPAAGILPSSTTYPTSRTLPSSRPRSIMRAPSHIDFRTAVKMSQQAAFISGVPKLTPLPTYQSQIVDECYSYTPTPEPDLRYTPEIEQDDFALSRGATPQTPTESFDFNGPVPSIENTDYLDYQMYPTDGLVPVGLGFADLAMSSSGDTWITSEPEEVAQANVFAQSSAFTPSIHTHNDFDTSLSMVPEDWSNFTLPVPDSTVLDTKEIDVSLDSGIVLQGEWTQPTRQDTYVDMGNMITSAPYVPKMQMTSCHAPVWEDVFMPSSIPC